MIANVALAEDQANTTAKYKKPLRLKINFEEDLVKGNTANPDLSNIQASKNFNLKKMIKIKENFIPQVELNGQSFEK